MRTPKSRIPKRTLTHHLPFAGILLGLLLIVLGQTAFAQEGEDEPAPFHPAFTLLDAEGENVLATGRPVSTMETCGACHDAEFIEQHSFHSDVGLSELTEPGQVAEGRPWDISPGLFGKWNPLTYRYLSPAEAEKADLTTPGWIQEFGSRHIGGGPAVTSRAGEPLTDLSPTPINGENSLVDTETGAMSPWDWQESGVVEMNCFLCHMAEPNNQARITALETGEFGWAATATLLGSGAVEQEHGSWQWNPSAFEPDGTLREGTITVQDPTNENCGQCHGLVHTDIRTPLVADNCSSGDWSTLTTGQIISPQKLSDSGLNLDDKDALARTWDVHAERVVGCTDCHYSLNNPVYFQQTDEAQPEHLVFDPRRIDLGDYLYRPLHQFAKGQSAQSTLAPELDNSIRRCESCHSIEASHDWLPYKERHAASLSCETCHVPKMYAPARQYVDWTVLKADGTPETGCRGVEANGGSSDGGLITGFEPVLLPRDNGDGSTSLAPYNLITSWYWVYGDPERPVPLADLEAAWLSGDTYHPKVLAVFDSNGDGQLDTEELRINAEDKEELIRSRLAALGLENPRIVGELQPYSINHDVTHGEWATKDCQTCHSDVSRVNQPTLLSDYTPGGVMPVFFADGNTTMAGRLDLSDEGELYYQPESGEADLYVLGHDNVGFVDWAGALIFLGTFMGVVTHGGLRFYAARRNAPAQPELREVYMYGVYERLWHWLQTAAILALIFTGLIIHKPDQFGVFSFRYVVQVHNILAIILLVNAALAVFYHLASGEIRQFLPRPRGFFDQAIEQAMFYLRGIFRGEAHPFEKSRRRKMNPLQQITYLAILNVLLPLQIITGALMWGVQKWPEVAARAGGLPFLAPVHTMVAWLFASFIVLHVYLTTMGHAPMASIKSMIMGWDEIEVHPSKSTEEVSYP
jgi:thiosulfate reductase cytochrome b subunit